MAIDKVRINNKKELEEFTKERRTWQPDFEFEPCRYPVIIMFNEVSGPIRPYVEINDEYPEVWKSMNSAPTNGTVILTDKGTAKYINGVNASNWYLCDTDGCIPSCAEEGMRVSEICPTKWIEVPEVF